MVWGQIYLIMKPSLSSNSILCISIFVNCLVLICGEDDIPNKERPIRQTGATTKVRDFKFSIVSKIARLHSV